MVEYTSEGVWSKRSDSAPFDAMKPFYKKLTFELSVTAAVVVVLLVGVLLFASNISASVDDLTMKRAELVKRWSSLKALATLLSDYNEKAREYQGTLEQALPRQDALFGLGKEFQGLAARNGVDAAFTFMGEEGSSENGIGAISYQLSVTGDMQSLIAFVPALEQFKYLSTIDSLKIDSGTPKSALILRGRVYFRE